MKIQFNTYFLSFTLLGLFVYFCQSVGIILPRFINNYLNDILCIPITLFIVWAIVRYLKGKHQNISVWMIACVVAYFSFYFEYFLPQIKPRYTSDPIDVGCYFLGGILFYIIQRYSLSKQA